MHPHRVCLLSRRLESGSVATGRAIRWMVTESRKEEVRCPRSDVVRRRPAARTARTTAAVRSPEKPCGRADANGWVADATHPFAFAGRGQPRTGVRTAGGRDRAGDGDRDATARGSAPHRPARTGASRRQLSNARAPLRRDPFRHLPDRGDGREQVHPVEESPSPPKPPMSADAPGGSPAAAMTASQTCSVSPPCLSPQASSDSTPPFGPGTRTVPHRWGPMARRSSRAPSRTGSSADELSARAGEIRVSPW